MKVLAINGSPRKNGNTLVLIETVLAELKGEGIDTEVAQLGGKKIHGCTACMKCFDRMDQRCAVDKDMVNELLPRMIEADAIIIGTPTYFANVTSEVKALIDRTGLVAIANGHLFRRKIGAAVVAVRRAGSTDAFDAINKFFFINQFVVPGSSYWNVGIGLDEQDVKNDEEGMNTMKVLGENMAWLLKKIHA